MRLYDSDTAIAALRRLGFSPRHEVTGTRKPTGSHLMMAKRVLDARGHVIRTLNAPVPLNKKPIKRGTMKSILTLLEISEEQFESVAR